MNKEYIEREDLLQDIKLLAKSQTGYRQQGILGVCETIRMRKVADVEPVRHGKWKVCCEEPSITPTSAGVSKFWFECSLCGRRESQKESYCHCGAKMDGGKSND